MSSDKIYNKNLNNKSSYLTKMLNNNNNISSPSSPSALKLDIDEGIIYNNPNDDNYKDIYSIDYNKDDDINNNIDKEKVNQPNTDKDLTIASLYENWKEDPTQENFSRVLKSLQPTIRYALASNNSLGDTLIETKAKVLAAKAIRKYDPEYGTGLPTYLTRQLQKLTRVTRDLRNPVKIPERFYFEAAALSKAENDFKDKYEREPSLEELADASGMSIKKIGQIRNKFLKQISEGSYFANVTSEDTPGSVDLQKGEQADMLEEAMGYVYNTLDHRDKKIMEYTTGYMGSDKLTPKEISKKLNISQSQISRITAKIANNVYDVNLTLEKIYNK